MTTDRRDNLLEFDDAKKRDDALIAETMDTQRSPYPKLFMQVSEGVNAYVRRRDVHENALVDDFFGIAREAAERVREGTDADQKVLPILFLYRHAVELALKLARRQLVHAMLQHEPGFKPAEVGHLHRHKVLLGEVRGLHRKVQPYLKSSVGNVKFISAQAAAFITELDRVDRTGMGFRYSRALEGKKKPIVKSADVGMRALILGMQHVQLQLDWFTTMIENSATLLDERNADHEAEDGGY